MDTVRWTIRRSERTTENAGPENEGPNVTTEKCRTEFSRAFGPAFSACGCGAARTDLCVVDPGGEFLGREAAEDERVNGAEPGARQHRDDRLGYHRHVDEHAVALHHAATLKHRRQLRYLRARTYTYNNDNNEGGFLFQRLSMLIQRFNPVLLHDCFVDEVVGHSS